MGLGLGGVFAVGAVSLAQRAAVVPKPKATPPVAAAPAPPPGDSKPALLTNPGFEEGDDAPVGWGQGNDVPGVAQVWSHETAHTGKSSLGFQKSAKRFFPIAEWSQKILRQGELPRLRVVGWVRAEKAGKAVLDVQFRGKDGDSSHAWACYIGALEVNGKPVTHDWKRYEGVVAIPPNTAEINIAPQMYGPGAVWFDDLTIEYTDAPAIDPTKPAVK